ncbi:MULTISPECIES: site-specific integrase [Bradyrhizobium]|uniref:site-specific integrase n=1 Tax=Bradyrhizobium TaxID=374 RepID=UPI001ED9F2CF|nr:site-specific integrase [Bradyrhizobium zhengyangense]MCG2639426.1 site-specific integrase [Bradyrhizobium zhengyangense]
MKFTDASVVAVQPTDREQWFKDDALPGLYLRVQPSGAKSYAVKYSRRGKSQTVTIGRVETWNASQARAEAKQLLAAVNRGIDPAADRAARRAALSLHDVTKLWLGFDPMDEKAKAKKAAKRKASTQDGYARALRLHVIPRIGSHALDDINTAAIGRVAKALHEHPAQRNKTLRVLSSLFTWAGKNGHCQKSHNPAAATEVERVVEEGKERFLTSEELTRLGEAIRQAETVGLPVQSGDDPRSRSVIIDQFAAAAIRLLLLTGCRLREVLNLEWTRVDFERGVINLSEAKRGRRPVILNAPALQILSELPRIGRFVIASTVENKPRADIKRAWQRVRAAAGLPDVRGHDLRHTAGAVSASSGLGLQITGALLGHKSVQATQRYAHLADDPLRRAAERVGSEIASRLGVGGGGDAEIVELKHVKR